MAWHTPGTAFVRLQNDLREPLSREAVCAVLGIGRGQRFTPIGQLTDEQEWVQREAAPISASAA